MRQSRSYTPALTAQIEVFLRLLPQILTTQQHCDIIHQLLWGLVCRPKPFCYTEKFFSPSLTTGLHPSLMTSTAGSHPSPTPSEEPLPRRWKTKDQEKLQAQMRCRPSVWKSVLTSCPPTPHLHQHLQWSVELEWNPLLLQTLHNNLAPQKHTYFRTESLQALTSVITRTSGEIGVT